MRKDTEVKFYEGVATPALVYWFKSRAKTQRDERKIPYAELNFLWGEKD
jgi:hypothetical protein